MVKGESVKGEGKTLVALTAIGGGEMLRARESAWREGAHPSPFTLHGNQE